MTRKKPPAKPPQNPFAPPYVTPKQKAAARGERLRFLYWAAVALPLIVTLMLVGYTDQAPRWLRAATESLDAMFGYPVLRLVAWIAGAA
jgi:hypothetical protein